LRAIGFLPLIHARPGGNGRFQRPAVH
jgi:hypothetical protein